MAQQLANAAHDTEGWVGERHGSARSMGRASEHAEDASLPATGIDSAWWRGTNRYRHRRGGDALAD